MYFISLLVHQDSLFLFKDRLEKPVGVVDLPSGKNTNFLGSMKVSPFLIETFSHSTTMPLLPTAMLQFY
jgi:hypothetical protein